MAATKKTTNDDDGGDEEDDDDGSDEEDDDDDDNGGVRDMDIARCLRVCNGVLVSFLSRFVVPCQRY